MARTAIALGGGIVGGLIGGPTGASIGFSIGNFLGGIFFGDDPEQLPTITGPRLNDTTVSTSTYGKGIPIFFGSVRVGGNMIWATEIQEVRREETLQQEGSGKGQPDPPTQTRVTFEYFGSFAMAFAEGPGFVRRIFADGKLIVDLSDEFEIGASKTFKFGSSRYRFFNGTETQQPDPLIEADKGVGDVPGFRGLIYVVFDTLPLRDFGNRIPQISAELTKVAPAAFTSINDDLNPGGGTFGRDEDYFDRSGFTTLAYNTNTELTVFSSVTRAQVLRVDQDNIVELRAAMTEVGLGDDTFFTHRPFVDPSSGMLSLNINKGNPGGTGLFVGILRTPAEDPVADLQNGTWQFVLPGQNFQYKFTRVYLIGGVRYLFGATGLVDHDILEATPFIDYNIGSILVPEIVQVVKTTATQSSTTTSFNGNAVPDDTIVQSSGQEWFNAAYDPVGQRAWFLIEPTNVIVQFKDGAFLAPLDLNTVLDPLHSTAGNFSVRGIAYDLTNDVLVVVAFDDHFTVNPDTYAVINFAGDNTSNPITDGGDVGHVDGFTSNLWGNQETIERFFHEIVNANDLVRWNTDELTTPVIRYLDADFGGDDWDASDGPIYVPLLNAFYTTLNTSTWGFIDRLSKTTAILGEVIDDLVGRTGVLDSTDTDTVDVPDVVRGYVIENPGTIRSMLEPLQRAFFFDGAEIDGILVFKKRDGTSLQTITSDELGAKPSGSDTTQSLNEPRKQETEVPRKVDVTYLNIDNDYQLGTQRDQRIQENPNDAFNGVTRSRQTAELRLPIVLNDQEARNIASLALSSAWVERTSLEFTLPPKFMRLDPTDIITIQKVSSFLTSNLEVRLTQVEIGTGGVLNCSGLLTEAAVFQPNVTAQNIDGSPTTAIKFPVGTNLFLLNLPNLQGNLDNTGAAYWGAAPDVDTPNPAWEGSILFRALEDNGTQIEIDSTFVELRWGLTRNAFAPPPDAGGGRNFTTRERTLTLTVDLQTVGVLSTISDLALFDGGNYAYIPASGELFQFQTATLNADNNFDLTVFLRGQRGTEVFVAGTDGIDPITVPSGSEIVFLGDLSTLFRFSDASERGLTRFYEAITVGGQLGEFGNDNEQFINTSAALIPLSPADFLGTRDGSDNIDLTWKRRERINHELLDLVDVPLNEQGEAYEVDVLDRNDNSAVVIRTITGLVTQVAEYAIADQQVDVQDTGDFPLALVVENAGFEDGIFVQAEPSTVPGWPVGVTGQGSQTGTWGTRSAALGSIAAAQAGTFYLFTTDTIPNELQMTSAPVFLTGLTPVLNLTELDENTGRFQLTAAGQSAQGDVGGLTVETRMQLRFFDEDSNLLSSSDGTAAGHSVAGTYEARSVGPVDIPAFTRFVTVRLYSNDVGSTNDIQIGWDAITLSLTDTASGTVQRFSFDVFQISGTVGRGRGRRTIAPTG